MLMIMFTLFNIRRKPVGFTTQGVNALENFDLACLDALYFHGTLEFAKQRVGAWALLYNFILHLLDANSYPSFYKTKKSCSTT
jgi:hypothetical protein